MPETVITNQTEAKPALRLPEGYNAESPETQARRRKLFATINAGYSPQWEQAMDQICQRAFDGLEK